MSKVSEFYGGTYITGADLAGKTHRLQVKCVEAEEVGDDRERKLVVYFTNAQKGLVLNKTNASTLVSVWSDETDEWRGRWLEAFTVPVTFNGRTYDGVRVRPVVENTTALMVDPPEKPQGVPASQTKAAMKHAQEIGDGVPF